MYKVLIVDDEQIIRIGLRTIIDWEAEGFKVCGIVNDGKQALEFMRQVEVDVVITDIKMPNIDGIQLIQKLQDRGFVGGIIMLTSYGEFELARAALRYGADDYLLKGTLRPVELINSLKSLKEKLQLRGVSEVVENDEAKIYEQDIEIIQQCFLDSCEYKANEINQYVFKRSYRGIVIQYVQSDFEKEVGKKNTLQSYKQSIENIISELNTKDLKPIVAFNNAWGIYMIPHTLGIDEMAWEKLSLQIHNHIKLYTNIRIATVRTKKINTTEELLEAVKQCMAVAKLTFYKGYQQVLNQEVHSEIKAYMVYNYKEIETALKDYLAEQAFEQAIKCLGDYMRQIREDEMMPGEVKKRISSLWQRILLDYGIYLENHVELLENIIKKYKKSTLLREYEEVLGELIFAISQWVDKSKKVNYRREVVDIMEYVDAHIGEKISLTTISKQVNMNESYVSRLFKSETDMNIINYINMKKMEKAKELLKKKDMIVKDVAYALGFEEQSYFNRMFNKYFGINPKEYKKSINS